MTPTTCFALGLAYLVGIAQGLGAAGELKWHVYTDASTSIPALGERGTLYTINLLGMVSALDSVSGTNRWVFQGARGGVLASPAIGENNVVYAGLVNAIYALDGDTGTLRWEFGQARASFSGPALGSDGALYVAAGKKLFALDAATGTKRWEAATAGARFGSPVIDGEGRVYCCAHDLRAFATDTGKELWRFSAWGVYGVSLDGQGTVYAGSDLGVVALNAQTGAVRWMSSGEDAFYYEPTLDDRQTVFAAGTLGLYALDAVTGRQKWVARWGGSVGTAPVVGSDGSVYAGSGSPTPPYARLLAVDGATGGIRWAFDTLDCRIYPGVIGADGTLYGATCGLYALETLSLGGLADSPWPKARGNARGTGRVNATPPRLGWRGGVRTVRTGSSATLQVSVRGWPRPRIQWYLDQHPILGATADTYSILFAGPADAGAYSVSASNCVATVTSSSLTVVVNNIDATLFATILAHPNAGSSVELLCAHQVAPPIEWQAATNPIAGAGGAQADLAATSTRSGFYRARGREGAVLQALRLPGWYLETPVGSKHRIEFVDEANGWRHWQFLTSLTQTFSPELFLDTSCTNGQPRVYRSTQLE